MATPAHDENEDQGLKLPLTFDELTPAARGAVASYVRDIFLKDRRAQKLIVALWWSWVRGHAVRGLPINDMPHRRGFDVDADVHDSQRAVFRKRYERAWAKVERIAGEIDRTVDRPIGKSLRCPSCQRYRPAADRFCGDCGEHMGEPTKPES